MNLQARHVPILVPGAALGAALGWLIGLLAGPGVLAHLERTVGPRVLEIVIGGMVGFGLTVLILLFASVRDPSAEASRNFTRVNGIGSALFGRADVGPDGSFPLDRGGGVRQTYFPREIK